jgi:hypothetical protein
MNSGDSRVACAHRQVPDCHLDERRIVRLARCDTAQEAASRRLLDGYEATRPDGKTPDALLVPVQNTRQPRARQ